MNQQLKVFASSINSDLESKSLMKIGKRLQHPDGYLVEITNGQYLSNGRVSNFWYWKRVNKNGTLSKVEEHGYGW